MSSRPSTRFLASLFLLVFYSLADSFADLPSQFQAQQELTNINKSAILPTCPCRRAATLLEMVKNYKIIWDMFCQKVMDLMIHSRSLAPRTVKMAMNVRKTLLKLHKLDMG
ncbi:Synaptosomal-associated 23 [Gossypium arboreum]|uniref:Synaptosomal-associated 23 n=1 Tax=Gossypium arboreum TaxID=29729 RepID=A0A0B0MKW8_GOSAR|nr:Synaptosomal-associated 23 [Gossypium arboreum]